MKGAAQLLLLVGRVRLRRFAGASVALPRTATTAAGIVRAIACTPGSVLATTVTTAATLSGAAFARTLSGAAGLAEFARFFPLGGKLREFILGHFDILKRAVENVALAHQALELTHVGRRLAQRFG